MTYWPTKRVEMAQALKTRMKAGNLYGDYWYPVRMGVDGWTDGAGWFAPPSKPPRGLLPGRYFEPPITEKLLADAPYFDVVAVGAMKPDNKDMSLTCVVLCGEGGCLAVASVFYAHAMHVWPRATWIIASTELYPVAVARAKGQVVAVVAPWRIHTEPDDGPLLPSDFWTQGRLAVEGEANTNGDCP